jgi:serine/threonine protein kinase
MDPADESPVTELFDEYRLARETGRRVDPEPLLERAGSARAELEGRIRVFEQLAGLSQTFRAGLADAKKPRTLGRFVIERSLGRGGLSRVFLALDPTLGRTVALKVLDQGFLADSAERLWILNEARSLARLAHPGVVQVFDVGQADGFDFVELEHLTGPTLGQVIRALRSLRGGAGSPTSPPPETFAVARALQSTEARLRLLQRLASALAYCHNRGVIHRDIKPDNVVLDREARPKLVDFGLAHQAADGDSGGERERPAITEAFIGTRAYLAPEQVEGKRTGADPRSDQFSLGTLAYELLALVHPFAGATDAESEAAVRRADPERLRRRLSGHSRASGARGGAPRELEIAIHRALARLPDERYANVQAFADDLQAILEHRPISSAPPPHPGRARRRGAPRRRRRRRDLLGLGRDRRAHAHHGGARRARRRRLPHARRVHPGGPGPLQADRQGGDLRRASLLPRVRAPAARRRPIEDRGLVEASR